MGAGALKRLQRGGAEDDIVAPEERTGLRAWVMESIVFAGLLDSSQKLVFKTAAAEAVPMAFKRWKKRMAKYRCLGM